MISNSKLAKWVVGSTFIAAVAMPAIALAQEAEAGAAGATAAVDWRLPAAKALCAAIAMAVSAFSAAYAQSKIGAAAAGTLAERPEVGTNLIVLQALPEVIVLLGFVIAFMINAG